MQDMDDTDQVDGLSDGGNDNHREILADPPVRGLVYHAVLYFGVMLILLAVNLRVSPDFLWVQWIAFLWGLLLVWNIWTVVSARR